MCRINVCHCRVGIQPNRKRVLSVGDRGDWRLECANHRCSRLCHVGECQRVID
ncbi:MAG: hypothetical protein JNL58_00345 [Planctomyces sp.]|nr:hypothetical protein [Planctomyces sp.]